MNSNVIPKILNIDKITNFWPTIVAIFRFEIITKILVDRVINIACKIISNNRNNFIKGRNIKDYVSVAFEVIIDYKDFLKTKNT